MVMCDPARGKFDEEVTGNRFNDISSAGTEGQLDNHHYWCPGQHFII
jgi:hypothetical protein